MPADFVDRILRGQNPVKAWRDYRGLTSAALAEKVGLPETELDAIEQGKPDVGVGTLKRIAEVLRVRLDDLV